MIARKTLLWILSAVGGAALLAAVFWAALNLWPRPTPPALYREAELDLPHDPAQNAWEALQSLRNSHDLSWEDIQVPEELEPLLGGRIETKADFSAYWEEVERLQEPLKAFLQKNPRLARELLKIPDRPQWVDVSSPPRGFSSRSILVFLDYHRWISLYEIQLAVEGNVDGAYALWRKVYVQDLAWLRSARSFLSHLMAVGRLRRDLEVLLLLWNAHPPLGAAEWIQWLRAHPPGDFSLSRAVKYEYLERLAQLDSVATNAPRAKLTPLFRWLFNPALLRESLNGEFRTVEKILQGPPRNWEPGLKQVDQEVAGLRQGFFWWFSNPGGKTLLQLVHVSLVQPTVGFLEQGEKAKQLYQRALVEGREIGQARLAAPAETLPEETPAPSSEPEKVPEESPPPAETAHPENSQ